MLKKWGVLLLGALVASAVLIVGANAVTVPVTTPSLDLSSRAAVMKYLASHGIDSKKIVIQRGARNYAGPHCPGRGWTCTTSKHVVQISYAHERDAVHVHALDRRRLHRPPNDCLIVQSSDGAANYAYCTEKIADPTGRRAVPSTS